MFNYFWIFLLSELLNSFYNETKMQTCIVKTCELLPTFQLKRKTGFSPPRQVCWMKFFMDTHFSNRQWFHAYKSMQGQGKTKQRLLHKISMWLVLHLIGVSWFCMLCQDFPTIFCQFAVRIQYCDFGALVPELCIQCIANCSSPLSLFWGKNHCTLLYQN